MKRSWNKKNIKSVLLRNWLCLGFLLFGYQNPAFAAPGDRLKFIPVQDGGRVKPYETFANEMLEVVYGKKLFEGRPATEIVLTWMLSPEAWREKKIFEIRNHEILKSLGLNQDQRHYSGPEIFGAPKFAELMRELQDRRESKEKLTPYFQALQRIENQFIVFREIASGKMFHIIPPKEGTQWISLAELDEKQQAPFIALTKAFVAYLGSVVKGGSPDTEIGGPHTEPTPNASLELDQRVDEFIQFAKEQNPEKYISPTKIEIEVFYNSFHPFRWTYICYLAAALSLIGVWLFGLTRLLPLTWLLTAAGFLLHAFGFGIRIFLMERPPVSNMYETVVWMSWGCLLFALIIEFIYKFRFVLLAGLLGSVFALVIADSAPVVLDPSLQPLEPVLRSNYWLIIHVMTITISYAAFFLAFVLGEIGMIYHFLGEQKYQDKIKPLVLSIYRAIQIGVCFLAPGIILGGVWADYSWGRFWGWDPKETWALIALLGYIAVLHGRLVGWVRDWGLIACSIVTFNLVIMAWYGVNFVLGAGLHSYGFGAGGVEYVAVFVAIHLGLVLYLSLLHRSRLHP